LGKSQFSRVQDPKARDHAVISLQEVAGMVRTADIRTIYKLIDNELSDTAAYHVGTMHKATAGTVTSAGIAMKKPVKKI